MRGSLGLVIGLAVGAGAMYLALRRPWVHPGAAPPDAAAVAAAPADAGSSHHKRHHHRRGRHHAGGGRLTSGDDPGWGGPDTVEEVGPTLVHLSAAERALQWRGDNTARPPQKIDMAGGESRSLTDGEIQDVIAGQSGPVQACVVQAATNTDLRGTITVRMIVAGNGHVTKSKVQAPRYLFEHGLLPCVQRAVRGMHFPAVGQDTLVTLPVKLT